jgi:hypothetical protein
MKLYSCSNICQTIRKKRISLLLSLKHSFMRFAWTSQRNGPLGEEVPSVHSRQWHKYFYKRRPHKIFSRVWTGILVSCYIIIVTIIIIIIIIISISISISINKLKLKLLFSTQINENWIELLLLQLRFVLFKLLL